jgi:hypothetical protein
MDGFRNRVLNNIGAKRVFLISAKGAYFLSAPKARNVTAWGNAPGEKPH